MTENDTHREQAQERDRIPITRRQFALVTGTGLGSGIFSSGVTAHSSNRGRGPENAPPEACHGIVRSLIARMSLEEKIGQMLLHLPRANEDGMPDENSYKAFSELKVGSSHAVTTISDPVSVAKFNNQLQTWASNTQLDIPLLIAGNFESGAPYTVANGGTEFPHQMGIAATHDSEHIETMARVSADEIRAMGFNWTLSPIADVNTNPDNPVIGVRAFGDNTEDVSEMTSAQVRAYQDSGVLATPKHFPGHGDTDVDSHYGLPIVTYDRETLEEVHLPPFQAAIDAGAESIMTSHIIIEAIDPDLPATLSQEVMSGLLREDMGFDGIIIADSMRMDALTDHWDPGEAAVLAVKAGVDLINAKGGFEDVQESYEAILAAVEAGEISEERVNESIGRILRAKCKYGVFDNRYADTDIAEELRDRPAEETADEIARDSITLVKNDGPLPFDADSGKSTLIVAGSDELATMSSRMEEVSNGNVIPWQRSTNPDEGEIAEAVTEAKEADQVILTTSSSANLSSGQANFVEALVENTATPVATVATGLPYDIREYPVEVDAHLTSFAFDRFGRASPPSLRATVDVVFGVNPSGQLPVKIEDIYPYKHGLTYE